MIHPSAGDRWNRKHDRDDQDAFAIRDRNDAGKQNQRKQTGYNEFAAFNFLDERRPDEKEAKRNQKLHRGKATKSEARQHRFR
jgi:hypothetical protein